jgi:hypothetical protein
LSVLIENSQEFKFFWDYLKALVENYFKLSIISRRTSLRKPSIKSIIFYFIQTYASYACKGMKFQKIYKDCISELRLRLILNYYFTKYYFLHFSKKCFLNPNSIILCKQHLHAMHVKFYSKTYLIRETCWTLF